MGKVQEVRSDGQATQTVGDSCPLAPPGVEGTTYTYRRAKGLHSLLKPCKVRYRFTRLIVKRWRTFVSYAVAVRFRLARWLRFRFIRSLAVYGFRLWVRKIHNPEKLPKTGSVLIVSNHVSYYDWIVLGSILPKHTVFLAAKELQWRPIVRWLLRLNTLVYVDRDYPGVGYFREVMRQFQQRRAVVIYPEGQRSRTGTRQPVRLGFVKLALAAGVPIVLVGMKGTYEILPPHKRMPRFKRCEIFVGDPIFVSPESALFQDLFALAPDTNHLSDEILQEMAERVMDEIAKMLGPEWDGGRLQQRAKRKDTSTPPKVPPAKVAAFFDVDRTVVRCHTQLALARFCFSKRLFPFGLFAKSLLWGLMDRYGLAKDTDKLRELFYSGFRKRSIKEWEGIFDGFFEHAVQPKFFRSALDLIRDHQRRGHTVVLVSASLEPIILRLKERLGVDYYLATELATYNGVYTGRIQGPLLVGSAKVSAITKLAREHSLDLSQSYGYSDGFSDVRWLAKVGLPRIVNPDRKLSLFSKRRQWHIARFVR